VDNFTWTRGAHSLKVGADAQTTYDYMDQLFNRYGRFAYANITSFARDFTENTTGAKNYTTFTQAFGNPIHHFRTSDMNYYVQDTWKISPQFTLNLGLRYERAWLPQPTTPIPTIRRRLYCAVPSLRRALLVPFTEDKSRAAGYGIYYARIHGNMLDTLFLGNGLYQTSISLNNTQAGAPVFPTIFTDKGSFPSSSSIIQFAARNFYTPYTQQGTLAVERQVGRDLGLTVSYLWSRGVGLITQKDVNLGPESPTPVTYTIKDAAGNNVSTFTTPVSLFANRRSRYSKILLVENGGNSVQRFSSSQTSVCRMEFSLSCRTPGRMQSMTATSKAPAGTSLRISITLHTTATTVTTRAAAASTSVIAPS
jgi:hypothetical protein